MKKLQIEVDIKSFGINYLDTFCRDILSLLKEKESIEVSLIQKGLDIRHIFFFKIRNKKKFIERLSSILYLNKIPFRVLSKGEIKLPKTKLKKEGI
jgi:hypothetical protein